MGLFSKVIEEQKIPFDSGVGSIKLDRVDLPSMKESVSGNYVNYGDNNNYPSFLNALASTSALHRACIDNISRMIAGSDIEVNGLPIKEWVNTLTGATSIRIQNLIYHSKYPMRSWVKRTARDYKLFGAYSSELIWDSKFEYVKCLKHIDNSKIRSGVMDKNRDINKYYYSDNWSSNLWSYNSNIVPISTFDIENDSDTNQIIYKRDYISGLDYYTEPGYVGGITYINMDSELGLFSLSHIQNGLNPGIIFKVPYPAKTQEEKQRVIAELMAHFKGARNNNNPLILFKNGEATWEIEKVELNNFDAQMITICDSILQQLVFSHQITNGALVGLLTAGRLGGTNPDELLIAKDTFNKNVIEPARLMLTETIETVFRTYGLETSVKITETPDKVQPK